MWSRYFQPTTLKDALSLLAEHAPGARLLNGGTDLMIEIERKIRTPSTVIDISRVAGLDEVKIDGGVVRIGAGVTHNQAVADARLRENAYALVRACWELGAPQIRNRATLAGNLVTASPANDTITPLWALGAQVTLKSLRGERHLSFEEFFLGVRRTALRPDEILAEISFPLPSASTRTTFLKLGLRRAQAIAVVNVAAVVEFVPRSQEVRGARIALGAVAPTIVLAAEAQQFLTGRALDGDTIEEAARLAARSARPIDDVRGTADYRAAMVQVHVARALRQLHSGIPVDYPERPVMLWGRTNGKFALPSQSASFPSWEKGGRASPIETRVNGRAYSASSGHSKTLLRFLRDDLHLTGTKEGCAEGECGACTVYLDGIAVMACMVPAPRAHGAEILTVEGLARQETGAGAALHAIQRAFIEHGGVQCGYCTPGFVMSGAKLLEEMPAPSLADIRQALTGNLCRCTGYVKILKALEAVAH